MSTTFHQELTLTNDLSWLVQVRDLIQRGVAEGNFPELWLNRLQIAVDEAITNIIEHGHEGHPRGSSTITLIVDVNEERFCIEIMDSGASFDQSMRKVDIDIAAHVAAGKSGGLGIFLMQRIMDQVDYHYRVGTSNLLRLVKFR